MVIYATIYIYLAYLSDALASLIPWHDFRCAWVFLEAEEYKMRFFFG